MLARLRKQAVEVARRGQRARPSAHSRMQLLNQGRACLPAWTKPPLLQPPRRARPHRRIMISQARPCSYPSSRALTRACRTRVWRPSSNPVNSNRAVGRSRQIQAPCACLAVKWIKTKGDCWRWRNFQRCLSRPRRALQDPPHLAHLARARQQSRK